LEVFNGFTGGKAEMEGKSFAKMTKDTKLLDKTLLNTDVDLIFAAIKTKGQTKITYA